jgi:hypothetical protein
MKDFVDRLLFARKAGIDTIVLTGDGEVLQNAKFLQHIAQWNNSLGNDRFCKIELQSTGVFVDDEMLRFMRNTVRVSTIALSVSDLFDSVNNCKIIGVKPQLCFDLNHLCSEIKRYDYNLRVSLIMLDIYNEVSVDEIFARLKDLRVDQVTFKVLYTSGNDSDVDKYVREHKAANEKIEEIKEYIKCHGKELEPLSFGAKRYSVKGISTVLDGNCMDYIESVRYMILQPNCRLYTNWMDPASLVF